MQDTKPLSTPLDPNHKLDLMQCPAMPHQFKDMHDVPYRKVIGSLMYAALGMRPDIVFMVSFLSQFMQNPGWPHWEAVKCVLHYLKGTQNHILQIGGRHPSRFEGYCNTD